MHHTGRVVSRTELVEHLYDQDFDRDSNTIEVFVGRIRKKLGVDVIQTVRGLGYLLTPPSAMRANFARAAPVPVSATGWTVVILLVTGFVLSSLYRQAVERAFDRRLGVYLKTLVADIAAPEDRARSSRRSLGEPLFELPLSGWYWQVTRLDTREAGGALVALAVGRRPAASCRTSACRRAPTARRKRYVPGPEDQRLRLVERNVDLGEEGRYLVAVAGDAAEIDDEIRAFDRALAVTFGVLGGGAAAHHHVPGALRPCAAQAHLRRAWPRSAPARPSGSKARSRSRSRRSRARPTR